MTQNEKNDSAGLIHQAIPDVVDTEPRLNIGNEHLAALRLILAEPFGCPACDSGTLRDPQKSHWDRCGFAAAKAIVEAL